MITRTPDLSPAASDAFLQRVWRLSNYVTRARKGNKGVILFAVWQSIVARRLVEAALEQLLESQDIKVIKVDVGGFSSKEVVSHLVGATIPPNGVLFIYNLEDAGEEGLRSLNYQRETFVQKPLHAIFWVRESELKAVARHAPDFWAFRHRVVDFPEMPQEPSFSQVLHQVYGDVSYESLAELQSKLQLRQALLRDLPEDAYSSRLNVLLEVGSLYDDLGKYTQAEKAWKQALQIAKKMKDKRTFAIVYHNLGMIAQKTGRLEEAEKLYRQSLAIEERLGDQAGIAITLHQLGMLAQDQGRLEDAEGYYRQSLEIAERLGDQAGIAITLHQLGNLAYLQGHREEAEKFYRQSLEIEERLGDQAGIASTLHQLGRLAQDQGRLEEAEKLYRQSLEIKERLGNQAGIATTLHQLGRLAEEAGRLEEAERLFRQALETFERLHSPDAEIARRSLARLKGRQKEGGKG